MSKFYITTPIYYASGAPHIGHSFATIYADVIARYYRIKKNDVFFLVGTDEHGSKVSEKATEEGVAPQEFVDRIAEKYRKAWDALNIGYDIFMRTTSTKHKEGVRAIFEKIKERGDIYEGFYEGLYCVGCEDFITEKELVNGLCPNHLTVPQKLQEKNYFFNLKKYLPEIKRKIINGELEIISETRKNEILKIIDSDIPDFSITREKNRVKWGIPFPFDDTQIIYVWVEALMNYVTALDFPDGEKFNKYWPADVHLVGADINKFHSLFWPGLLLSAGLPLPRKIFATGLITVNGQKMSKTIGNVIDPLDLVEKFGCDGVRYLTLSQFPASEHGDIKESGFTEKYNSDLANGIGNFLERVFTMVRTYEITLVDEYIDPEIKLIIESTEERYKSAMEEFNIFEAIRIIFSAIKSFDKYVNEKEPWNLRKGGQIEELSLVLNSLIKASEKAVRWLAPFLPQKTSDAEKFMEGLKNGNLSPGAKLNLFPRI